MIMPTQARREERCVLPDPPRDQDVPPERTCAVMAAQLEAREQDICAARRPRTIRKRPARGFRPPSGETVALSRRDAIVMSVRARSNGVEVFNGVTVGANPATQALLRRAALSLAAGWNMGWTELSVTIAEPRPWPSLVPAPQAAP